MLMESKGLGTKFDGEANNSTVGEDLLFRTLDVAVADQKSLTKGRKYTETLSQLFLINPKYVQKVTGNKFFPIGGGTESRGLTHKGCSSMSFKNM